MLLLVLGNVTLGQLYYKAGKGPKVKYDHFYTTVMPGQWFDITLSSPAVLTTNSGQVIKEKDKIWRFLAPETPGMSNIKIIDKTNGAEKNLIVFVLTPYSDMNGEYLNGYRIGNYPDETYKGNKKYSRPRGFIEVNNENKDIYISPHFKLRQFLCKQESAWPKYLILNPYLLHKLELLVAALQRDHENVNTLFIMSGYRTPFYNKAIGNVKFSRHIYGDAADVYVDENLDGVIDDLDKSGKDDMNDAMIIHKLAEQLEDDPSNSEIVGGIGKYKRNSAHTYFIHVDTRGYRARW